MKENSSKSKQEMSNERRLQSIKLWQRGKATKQKQIGEVLRNPDSSSVQNKKIIFNSDDEKEDDISSHKFDSSEGTRNSAGNKPVLFESSDSENDDYNFEIKSQFQGEKGQQLFELSSQFTDERFKLDERFKEESDDDVSEDVQQDDESAAQAEKDKNLEILERVLGFQVPRRPPVETETKRKRQLIRFDPESEASTMYIKKPNIEGGSEEKPKRKKARKKVSPPPQPTVSTERYFEVSGNLKEVLGANDTNEKFSFASKFSYHNEQNYEEQVLSVITDVQGTEPRDRLGRNQEDRKLMPLEEMKETNMHKKKSEEFLSKAPRRKHSTFFIGPDDRRLKEGVEFFRRHQPLETLREQWHVSRNVVVDMYKKNRRLAMKAPKKKSRNIPQKKASFSKKKYRKW